MIDIEGFLDAAEQKCESRGSRLTQKRKRVLSTLAKANKALSAYELIDSYYEECGEKMQAMSVYRILDFLEAEQLVHKLKLANKYIPCSHIDCDHPQEIAQFLICSECSIVTEIPAKNSLSDMLAAETANAEFQLQDTQIELSGLCKNCRI